MNSVITVGVEEEFYAVDDKSFMPTEMPIELARSAFEGKAGDVHSELHLCTVEVVTPVCYSTEDIVRNIQNNREAIKGAMKEVGINLLAAGIHPYLNPNTERLNNEPVYQRVINKYPHAQRCTMGCGLHAHIKPEDHIDIYALHNTMLSISPFLLALTANSPILNGYDTGLSSARYIEFIKMPRTGTPNHISSVQQYQSERDWYHLSQSAEKATSIWYDVRIHPVYGTLEFRVMDSPKSTVLAIGLPILIREIAKLIINGDNTVVKMPTHVIKENMWRAARDGINAIFASENPCSQVSARDWLNKITIMIIRNGADFDTKFALEGLLNYALSVDAPKQLREAPTIAGKAALLLL